MRWDNYQATLKSLKWKKGLIIWLEQMKVAQHFKFDEIISCNVKEIDPEQIKNIKILSKTEWGKTELAKRHRLLKKIFENALQNQLPSIKTLDVPVYSMDFTIGAAIDDALGNLWCFIFLRKYDNLPDEDFQKKIKKRLEGKIEKIFILRKDLSLS